MSLGLVVLEKSFTRTRTFTSQSDAIMSADIKMSKKGSFWASKTILTVCKENIVIMYLKVKFEPDEHSL